MCAAVCVLLGVSIACSWLMKASEQERKTVLYSTDLAIDGDFDDYFDLVVMKSLKGIDLKIIVDGNDSAQKQSGVNAIRNLDKIVGRGYRKSEVIMGRDRNLESVDDANVSEDLKRILERAKKEIDIVTVGSLRDVAALYNYCPTLFEEKVGKIWVFAGDAEGTITEYNVTLDERAFLRVMNTEKLEVYWIPCFQNGAWTKGTNASYFTIEHSEIFGQADQELLAWFLHRYEKSNADFQTYLSQEHDTGEFMEEERNLWCSPILPLVAGRMEQYWKKYCEKQGHENEFPFGFTEKKVSFYGGGKVEWGSGNTVQVFEIYDYEGYVDFGRFILEETFRSF